MHELIEKQLATGWMALEQRVANLEKTIGSVGRVVGLTVTEETTLNEIVAAVTTAVQTKDAEVARLTAELAASKEGKTIAAVAEEIANGPKNGKMTDKVGA